MKKSEKIELILKDLKAFRSNLNQPKKDGTNPHFHADYVTLEGVIQAVDEAVSGTGLLFIQEGTFEDKNVLVTTTIFHESGQFIEFNPVTIPAMRSDAQGLGSALTYAKRYSLSTAFGITSEIDDDGNAASKSGGNQKQSVANKQQYAYRNTTNQVSKPATKPVIKAKPIVITEEQKTTIFKLITEIAAIQNISMKEVMTAFNIMDLEKLNSDQATNRITTIQESLANMKK